MEDCIDMSLLYMYIVVMRKKLVMVHFQEMKRIKKSHIFDEHNYKTFSTMMWHFQAILMDILNVYLRNIIDSISLVFYTLILILSH
jgi:hypothetical protein